MIYAYNCPSCSHSFDVVKRAADMARAESCEKCGAESTRQFVPSRVHFIGTKVEHAEYNPGLGCVVRNSSHRKELAKAKGLEEVGSEPVEKLHKKYETERIEKLDRAYDEITNKGWVGDGT